LANDLGKEIKLIMGPDGKVINAGYLEAAKLAAAQGLHLPSNVLHDDYLVGSEKWNELNKKSYYAAWVREIIAYPEKDGMFEADKDVIDSGTSWTLEAKHVPAQAIGVKGVGLFIDPEEVKEDNGKMIVIPKTIIVLSGIIQESGGVGQVDPNTRIPLQVDARIFAQLAENEKRWFYRISGIGVRPLVRNDYDLLNRWLVSSGNEPSSAFGVGGA
jgi:hypothetical protein